MNAHRSLTVTTPSEWEIRLQRSFDAPRELVFAALTTPDLLKRWYGARGWNLVACEVDLRVGGRYRFVSRGPGGEHMGQSGTYMEIVEPSRLSYTEMFDDQSYAGESLITQILVESRGATVLTSTVRYASPQARDLVLRYPMARGVGQSYDRLDDVLVTTTIPAERAAP